VFVYNGETLGYEMVVPSDISAIVSWNYSGTMTTVNAGNYEFTYAFSIKDEYKNNYTFGDQQVSFTKAWSVAKAEINVGDYTVTFTPVGGSEGESWVYDGTTEFGYSVTVNGLPADKLTFTVGGTATAVNAGNYTVTYTIALTAEAEVNYTLVGTATGSKNYTVEKVKIDISGLTWNYSGAFTYTGSEFKVLLNIVPESIAALINVAYTGNAATEVGEYTATVTVTPVDADNYELIGTSPAAIVWEIVAPTQPDVPTPPPVDPPVNPPVVDNGFTNDNVVI
jgi:hypothetical protein